MGNIKTTCLRFNIDKPLHRKAWEILQDEEKSHSKIISEALVTGIADLLTIRISRAVSVRTGLWSR